MARSLASKKQYHFVAIIPSFAHGEYWEAISEGIDKAASLQALIERLGIKRDEVISFGDGYNDLSMIEFAKFGVAMANAVDEVKKRAAYITLSNDEEGIYECLKMLSEKGEI